MKELIVAIIILLSIVVIGLYGAIGTSGDVEAIKRLAPLEMKSRNWEIVRYEGWQKGSFANHGGKVWYHVKNIDNNSIQYRLFVTLWGGELHWTYGAPEKVSIINVDESIILTKEKRK